MNQLSSLLSALMQGGGFEDSASVKRFITATLGVGAVALHDKFGITLDDTQIAAIAGITSVYILQSGQLSAAKKKGLAAANAIVTPEDADKAAVSTPRGGIAPMLFLAMFGAMTFSQPALAQVPVDAGVVDAGVVERSSELVKLQKGDPAPFDGRLYSNDLHTDTQKRAAYLETTLKEVEPHVGIPVWQSVLITIGAIIVTTAVAVPIGVEVGKGQRPK